MSPETQEFLKFIGERLEMGEKQYGGFNFADYDLDKMALEEVGDFAVYFLAKLYLRMKKG